MSKCTKVILGYAAFLSAAAAIVGYILLLILLGELEGRLHADVLTSTAEQHSP